ncbi:ClpXP protease specificity-enhancing factor [Paraburkholderia caballeronis]|uniref:Stringent starvation protein B n=1 Tax=Paraburkholderia caballeronis TaxID=416943 RepID=A0A1H7V0J2_9BURK|nr:ClpXP protease specificity-enhancing factor [Paraburkholderia caballeronis]PXW17352.1 stringent starvation protein B [Paraburkholderia caballeronis]PXW94804.1 stringent starvation protein B [Paraburkholderia caballeronis]RAJ90702.1 stringent starvation protein B [Paraburkholderia caballeronis]TDV28502.1 stringent starvation protein B [Paraburkholderia caballeronis]SEB57863.1 stringent starvation protein B [Paraburkholderia caballeronis]
MQEISTKPYLLRALYEWCTDNGYTPHIAVRVDNRTRVPRQFVRDGEIVLNISFEATSQLQMGNEQIEFHARFSGKSHKIEVPVANVLAIYARENGQGMAFPVEAAVTQGDAGPVLSSEVDEHGLEEVEAASAAAADDEARAEPPAPDAGDDGAKGGKGHLKIVK